jgi:cytosine/adenosine deaminase-related metal-dependent hydrolase
MDFSLRRIASHYLLTQHGWLARPLITVKVYSDLSHEIVAVEEYSPESLDAMAGVEFYGGVLCAGFVNAHSHIELSYLKGAIAEGEGFAAFAESIGRVRGNFSEEERLAAIVEADGVMWQEGVDAVGDVVNGATSFATKAVSPIHYHNFVEVFGLRECNLERQRALLQYPNSSLTPHSTYSVQDLPFREVCGEDTENPLSIHFLESPAEAELYRGCGRLHEWYKKVGFECDFLHYGSPAERIVASTPKGRKVLLVHNCEVTERDVEIIASHFTTPVSWVLSPRSNNYISRIEPRSVALLRAREVNICIGTDSLASNWSLSMVEELKMFCDIPLDELLRWATINGAKALGIADKYGTIEVGKRSGIVNLTGVDLENFTLTDQTQAKRVL